MSQHDISVTVNGRQHRARVSARMTLVDLLRDVLGYTGTHVGCEHGVCGACSVLFNGQPIRSCLMFAVQADGAELGTVEGLSDESGGLSVLQDALWETHGLQCGYCTPGMLIAAKGLLQTTLTPTDEDIREAISGNLCRCTGYQQIVAAVRLAAERLRERSSPNRAADHDD
jgi:carbon-monoxide dehydrogenase small subunit